MLEFRYRVCDVISVEKMNLLTASLLSAFELCLSVDIFGWMAV